MTSGRHGETKFARNGHALAIWGVAAICGLVVGCTAQGGTWRAPALSFRGTPASLASAAQGRRAAIADLNAAERPPETEVALAGHATEVNPRVGVDHADETNFEEKVLAAQVPVLVDFYAEWCGPCQKLAPTLEQVARETPGVRIVKVNIDRNPELAGLYEIESVPSLLVFQEGRIVARREGAADKDTVKKLLRR